MEGNSSATFFRADRTPLSSFVFLHLPALFSFPVHFSSFTTGQPKESGKCPDKRYRFDRTDGFLKIWIRQSAHFSSCFLSGQMSRWQFTHSLDQVKETLP
ncbi:hypothetical protein LptCag_0845 [Leptospirillum ferriphilum]|uniref:Uncharacterized protein n=1 Tax=Leptospirillum ferriphilum TaxID=178606 RepID=A0A094W904_9BACT|nr:hypothetical protein LptCag_0845 [Leptospirillum ferriphilum]